ncbi:hypothetical protein HK405_008706, partial [Cladochytrium tenue]
GAVAEVLARVRACEQGRADDSERQRAVAEELVALRTQVEVLGLAAGEAGGELRARARELEDGARRGGEALRAAREQERAVEELRQRVAAVGEEVGRRCEAAVGEVRQRVEAEARARAAFEHGVRELYGEVRRALTGQERAGAERADAVARMAVTTAERERQDRERGLAVLAEGVRGLERAVREALQLAVEKLSGQIAAAEAAAGQERAARARAETDLRGEVEAALQLMQQAVARRLDEVQQAQVESRASVTASVTAVRESVVQVERVGEQRMSALEEVVRDEVRARSDTDRQLLELREGTERRTTELEQRTAEAITEAVEEARSRAARVEDDLKKTAAQLVEAKTRTLEDLGQQLGQLRRRVKEEEAAREARYREAQLLAENVGRDAAAAIEALQGRVEDKFTAVANEFEGASSTLKRVEDACLQMQVEAEEKINVRAQQLDSALEAFKVELDLRQTKKDANDAETRFEAAIGGVQSSVAMFHQGLQAVRDTVDQKASRKELEDSEARGRAQHAGLIARLVEQDAAVGKLREEVGSKVARKEMEEIQSSIKTMVLNLQVKDVGLEEMFERLQEDVNDRVSRKQLSDVEDRLRSSFLDQEARSMEFDRQLGEVKESLSVRVPRSELQDAEKKLTAAVYSVQDRVNEVSAAVSEAKTEISQTVREDVEEMVASINGALDAVQARADRLDNGLEAMRARIADADSAARARIQLVQTSLEAMVAEGAAAAARTRESATQQIQELAGKVEEVPRLARLAEVQQEEFRRRVQEQGRADAERAAAVLGEVREALAGKVDEKEVEALRGELRATVQRVAAQAEAAVAAAEAARGRLAATEAAARERAAELKGGQERAAEEQAQAVRALRDGLGRRLDEVEGRMQPLPRAVEQAWAELRRLRFEQDERIRGELARLERDVAGLRAEVAGLPSGRGVDASIGAGLAPLAGRLDRLARDIDELRGGVFGLRGGGGNRVVAAPQPEALVSGLGSYNSPPQQLQQTGPEQLPPVMPLPRGSQGNVASDYPMPTRSSIFKPEPVGSRSTGAPGGEAAPTALPPIVPPLPGSSPYNLLPSPSSPSTPPRGALDRIKPLSSSSSSASLQRPPSMQNAGGRGSGGGGGGAEAASASAAAAAAARLERLADLAMTQSRAGVSPPPPSLPPASPPTREF